MILQEKVQLPNIIQIDHKQWIIQLGYLLMVVEDQEK